MSDTFRSAPGARQDLDDQAFDGPPLRVAVIGTGGWWGRQHARVFAERQDTDLVAVVGRDPATTAARASEVHARPYVDLDAMLEAERPGLVSVSLPSQAHFETTMRLIHAGVPALVEKPLVFSLDEADQLIGEAQARDAFVAIDFNHRYARPVEMARSAIEAGRIGEISFATWRFGGEGDADHPDANLIETQCHGFDMLEYLVGPIVSISAEFTERPGRGHSTLAIALRFECGAVGSLVGSYDSSYAYRETHRLEVDGDAGRILVLDTVRRFEFQPKGIETAEVWEAGYFHDLDRSFHRTLDRHVDAVLQALRAGEPAPVPIEAGRRALRLALAAVRSFDEGRRVSTAPVAVGVAS